LHHSTIPSIFQSFVRAVGINDNQIIEEVKAKLLKNYLLNGSKKYSVSEMINIINLLLLEFDMINEEILNSLGDINEIFANSISN
jgi:hypothetical protein